MNETNFIDMLNCPQEYMLQAGGEYELISEMSFLRSIVKYKNCKIIIYGAGQRCEYLISWLKMENVPVVRLPLSFKVAGIIYPISLPVNSPLQLNELLVLLIL